MDLSRKVLKRGVLNVRKGAESAEFDPMNGAKRCRMNEITEANAQNQGALQEIRGMATAGCLRTLRG
jgi:hypothetical protein